MVVPIYLNRLQRIVDVRRHLGRTVQPAATLETIDDFRILAETQLGQAIPSSYLDFLMILDGFTGDGLEIYAMKRSRVAGNPGAEISGFIDANLEYRSSVNYQPLLIFGQASEKLFVLDTMSGKYGVVDNVSLRPIQQYSSFEKLLNHALDGRHGVS